MGLGIVMQLVLLGKGRHLGGMRGLRNRVERSDALSDDRRSPMEGSSLEVDKRQSLLRYPRVDQAIFVHRFSLRLNLENVCLLGCRAIGCHLWFHTGA